MCFGFLPLAGPAVEGDVLLAPAHPCPSCDGCNTTAGCVCIPLVQGLRDDALQGRVEAAVRDTLSAFAPNV